MRYMSKVIGSFLSIFACELLLFKSYQIWLWKKLGLMLYYIMSKISENQTSLSVTPIVFDFWRWCFLYGHICKVRINMMWQYSWFHYLDLLILKTWKKCASEQNIITFMFWYNNQSSNVNDYLQIVIKNYNKYMSINLIPIYTMSIN